MKKKGPVDAGSEDVHDDVVAAQPRFLTPLLWSAWAFGWTVLGLTTAFSVGGSWVLWGWGFPEVPEQWLALILALAGARLAWEGWFVATQRLLVAFSARTLWADSAGISIRVPTPRELPWEAFFSERSRRDFSLPIQEDRLAWEDVRGAHLNHQAGPLGTQVSDLVFDMQDGTRHRYDLRAFDTPGPEIFRRLDHVSRGALSHEQVARGDPTPAPAPEAEASPSRVEAATSPEPRGPGTTQLRPFTSAGLPAALLAVSLVGFFSCFSWGWNRAVALPEDVVWVPLELQLTSSTPVIGALAGAWFCLALCWWLAGVLEGDVREVSWDADYLALTGTERGFLQALRSWFLPRLPRRVVLPWKEITRVEVLSPPGDEETYLVVHPSQGSPYRLEVTDIPVDKAELYDRLEKLRLRARSSVDPAPESLGEPAPTLLAGPRRPVRWRVLGMIGWCLNFTGVLMFLSGHARCIGAFSIGEPGSSVALGAWLLTFWAGMILGLGGPRMAATGGPRLCWGQDHVTFDEPNRSWFPWVSLIGSARRGWRFKWTEIRSVRVKLGPQGPLVEIDAPGGPFLVDTWSMGMRPDWVVAAMDQGRRSGCSHGELRRLGAAAQDPRIQKPSDPGVGLAPMSAISLGCILLFFLALFSPMLGSFLGWASYTASGSPWTPSPQNTFRDEEGLLRWKTPQGQTMYVGEDFKTWSKDKLDPKAERRRIEQLERRRQELRQRRYKKR